MPLIDIDKNDVDISKLFQYSKEIEVPVPQEEEPLRLFVRLVGDAQFNRARTQALRESAEFRANLNNKRWKDRDAYISNVSKIKKDELIELLLAVGMTTLTTEIVNNIQVPFPSEPKGDAGQEDMEKYQAEVDAYPQKFNEEVSLKIKEHRETKQKEYRKIKREDLEKIYDAIMVNALCKDRYNTVLYEWLTLFGLYIDEKLTKAFMDDIEHFRNLPTHVKQLFMDEYKSLELSSSELKK